jgi:hypothetical protein
MATEFKPLTLLPLDEKQKRALIQNADSRTKSYDFIFNLSATPAQEWATAFNVTWYQAHQNTVARLAGKTIIVQSTIADLPNILPSVKETIARTNDKHAASMRQTAEAAETAQQQKDEAKKAAQEAMKAALNKLGL